MCLTHPNPSSLLKLQISQLVTRTKSHRDTGWDDTCMSTITPSSCNTEQSPHAPSTCSSTNKSVLFYPHFNKTIYQEGTGEMKSPTQVACCTVLLLVSLRPTGACEMLSVRYDGEEEPSSSLSPAGHTDPCTPCPALGLMVMAFWTISIYALLWQAAKGLLREQVRKRKQGCSEVRNSA